ncbi:MAG: carbon storage regulator [bacterium]
MLVLTRKVGESIQIGDDVVITITRNRGGTVSIGITAPQSVRIMRSELLESGPKLLQEKPPCSLQT